jgi:hypothetical protein
MNKYYTSVYSLENPDFKDDLIEKYITEICGSIAEKIISELKQIPPFNGMGILNNLWEEFCAQWAGEHFLVYSLYMDYLYELAFPFADKLSDDDYLALLMQNQDCMDEIIRDNITQPVLNDDDFFVFDSQIYSTYNDAYEVYEHTLFSFELRHCSNCMNICTPIINEIKNRSEENSRISAFNSGGFPWEYYPVSENEIDAYNSGYKTYARYIRAVEKHYTEQKRFIHISRNNFSVCDWLWCSRPCIHI